MDIDDDEFDSLLEDRERAEAEQHQEQEYPDDVIRPDEHRAAAQEEEEEEDVPLTRSKRPPIEVMPSVMDKRPRTLRGARLTLLGSETDAPFDEEDDDAAMRPSQSLRSQDDAMVVEEERPRIVMPVGPRVFVAPPVTGKYVSVRDPHNRDNTFYLRFRAPRPRSVYGSYSMMFIAHHDVAGSEHLSCRRGAPIRAVHCRPHGPDQRARAPMALCLYCVLIWYSLGGAYGRRRGGRGRRSGGGHS